MFITLYCPVFLQSCKIYLSVNIKPLETYVDSITEMINFYTYFTQSIENSLPILLLHGPNGCGKSMVVESMCSKLSLHLCQVKKIKIN
jgi:hypothetical protein